MTTREKCFILTSLHWRYLFHFCLLRYADCTKNVKPKLIKKKSSYCCCYYWVKWIYCSLALLVRWHEPYPHSKQNRTGPNRGSKTVNWTEPCHWCIVTPLVTKRESSETEALVECDEREEVIHNIHIDRHKYPPSTASAPASHTQKFSVDTTDSCQLQGSRPLNSLFIILRL